MAEAQEEPVVVEPDGEPDDNESADDEPVKKLSKKELAEQLRQQVDTVGKEGKPGEQIQNVISVGMLSEGWDARTVTHIMGLRAFSSQLLCEQVVGRGLRRVSYEFDKEKTSSSQNTSTSSVYRSLFFPTKRRTDRRRHRPRQKRKLSPCWRNADSRLAGRTSSASIISIGRN
jgi:superfamily II DNA or RNA helicase